MFQSLLGLCQFFCRLKKEKSLISEELSKLKKTREEHEASLKKREESNISLQKTLDEEQKKVRFPDDVRAFPPKFVKQIVVLSLS